MNRKITNLVLYITFCILGGTGILLMLAPKGIEWRALGIHEDIWKYAHIACALIMFACLAVHLALNKKWIEKVGASGRKWLVVTLIIAGLLLIIVPAVAPISLV